MKYMLLIHHGSTPVPGTEEWDALPAAEQGATAFEAGKQPQGEAA